MPEEKTLVGIVSCSDEAGSRFVASFEIEQGKKFEDYISLLGEKGYSSFHGGEFVLGNKKIEDLMEFMSGRLLQLRQGYGDTDTKVLAEYAERVASAEQVKGIDVLMKINDSEYKLFAAEGSYFLNCYGIEDLTPKKSIITSSDNSRDKVLDVILEMTRETMNPRSTMIRSPFTESRLSWYAGISSIEFRATVHEINAPYNDLPPIKVRQAHESVYSFDHDSGYTIVDLRKK